MMQLFIFVGKLGFLRVACRGAILDDVLPLVGGSRIFYEAILKIVFLSVSYTSSLHIAMILLIRYIS